jgi:hypothetical protein
MERRRLIPKEEPPRTYASKDPNTLGLWMERVCKICMERKVDVILLECGHLVACSNCAEGLDDCPLCRKPILRIKRADDA